MFHGRVHVLYTSQEEDHSPVGCNRNPEPELEPEYFSYKFFFVKKCTTLNTVFNMPCCRIFFFLPVISINDSGHLNLMFMIDIRAPPSVTRWTRTRTMIEVLSRKSDYADCGILVALV